MRLPSLLRQQADYSINKIFFYCGSGPLVEGQHIILNDIQGLRNELRSTQL
jgi:hypothetical protein